MILIYTMRNNIIIINMLSRSQQQIMHTLLWHSTNGDMPYSCLDQMSSMFIFFLRKLLLLFQSNNTFAHRQIHLFVQRMLSIMNSFIMHVFKREGEKNRLVSFERDLQRPFGIPIFWFSTQWTFCCLYILNFRFVLLNSFHFDV